MLVERAATLRYPDKASHVIPENPVRTDTGFWGLAYHKNGIRYVMTGVCEPGQEFPLFYQSDSDPDTLIQRFMTIEEMREFVDTVTTDFKEGRLPIDSAYLISRAQQRFCERIHNSVDKAVAV